MSKWRKYRGFKIERVIGATWIRTEIRHGLPRKCRSKINGYLCYYPDGEGSKWVDSLDDAKKYIDDYHG